MKDNIRTSIGYICVASCLISWFIMFAWIGTPQEFTFKIEIDNNTKEAVESVEYPVIDIEQPETICYSEICYLDLENNTIGGCSMSKADCRLWKDKYGQDLLEDEQDG